MAGHGSPKASKWEQTIAALLTSRSLAQAARQIGVARSTLQLWLADPDLQLELASARKAILQATITRVAEVTGKAVRVLEKQLHSRKAPVALQAAVALLRYSQQASQLDVAAEIAELRVLVKKTVQAEGGE